MRVLVTVHDARAGHCSDVYIEVDPSAKVGDIFHHLVMVVAADLSGADEGMAIDGRYVQNDTLISESGLRDGSWISLLGVDDVPFVSASPQGAVAKLQVVSGQETGKVYYCGPGSIFCGYNQSDQVHLTGGDSNSESLVEVRVSANGHVLAIPTQAGAELVLFNNEPLTQPVEINASQQLVFPDRIIELSIGEPEIAAVELNGEDNSIRYHRPPRIMPPEPEPNYRLPNRPAEPTRQPLPIVASLLPLLMAIVMAFAFQNPRMLLFGLFSPVMMISSFVTRTKFGQKRYKEQLAEYEDEKERTEIDAREAVVAERKRRRYLYPDAAEVARIALTPTPRLWERRPNDSHWLELRFGTANMPSSVTLEDPEELEHKRMKKWDVFDVPVTVNLSKAGSIGIAGETEKSAGLAKWALMQLAVLHSPRDVQVYLLSSPVSERGTNTTATTQWDFLTWIPHTKPAASQDTLRTVAATTQTLGARIAELTSILDSRQDALQEASQKEWSGPSLVVVVDGSHRLRTMPGIVRLLREGPKYGIYSICVDIDERLLPEECDTVIVANSSQITLRRQHEADLENIRGDWLVAGWAPWVARAISPVVDTSPNSADAAIPNNSRLLEVLRLDPPTASELQGRWALNPSSTRVVVGESLDGSFALDIVSDGPHGLIAGTTGSGKSELLQTIVASLAASNTPENMTFVLIDYKGGAAFKDCANLPHTVGMVTDLDTHLVSRALASLGAELKYREHILAAAGAKDLEDYQDLVGRNESLPKIPRLLIVIDEFASLARELPNFVSGLVNIAQRGRSLGIHLILATQRPSGVVSPEIRANTNLRIALRVTDTNESNDVIDAPDSARIAKSAPGRAFVRLGSNSLIPFQAGRVGGRAPNYDSREAAESIDPLIRPVNFHELADAPPKRHSPKNTDGDVEITDLRILVSAIHEAHLLTGFSEPRKPWLPALKPEISLEQLDLEFAQLRSDSAGEIWFGIEDHPQDQKQAPLAFSLERDGNLYVVGAARTGKTTALRSLALSASKRYSADKLHIYALDCGNGGLSALQTLPNVGSVIQRQQSEKAARLLLKVQEQLLERQRILSDHGCANLGELHALLGNEEAPAHTLLIIDSWEGFLGALEDYEGGRLVEIVNLLLREGASAGIHLIISGDRQLITGRMALLSDRKIVLKLLERSDFSQIGVNPRELPDEILEGRAFLSEGGVEVQIALPSTGHSGQEQAKAIREAAAALRESSAAIGPDRMPFSLAEMPTTLTRSEAEVSHGDLERTPGEIFIGLGGAEVQPCRINPLVGSATFVVAGPPKSGKTTALHSIAISALNSGYQLVIAAPKRGVIRDLEGTPGVIKVFSDPDELTEPALQQILENPTKPTLFLADDAELLREIKADMWLRGFIPKAQDQQVGLVIAGDTTSLSKGFTGWLVDMKKNRSGLLFAPQALTDGDVTGIRLQRSDLQIVQPIGRGYFTSDQGLAQLVQLAVADKLN